MRPEIAQMWRKIKRARDPGDNRLHQRPGALYRCIMPYPFEPKDAETAASSRGSGHAE